MMSTNNSQFESLVAAAMIYLSDNTNRQYTCSGFSRDGRNSVKEQKKGLCGAINERLSYIRKTYRKDLISMCVTDRVFSFLLRRRKVIMDDFPISLPHVNDLLKWSPEFLRDDERVREFDSLWKDRLTGGTIPMCRPRSPSEGVRVEADGHCVDVFDPNECILIYAPQHIWDFCEVEFMRLESELDEDYCTMTPGIIWHTSVPALARALEGIGVRVVWTLTSKKHFRHRCLQGQELTYAWQNAVHCYDNASGLKIRTNFNVCRSLALVMFDGRQVGDERPIWGDKDVQTDLCIQPNVPGCSLSLPKSPRPDTYFKENPLFDVNHNGDYMCR